MPNDKKIRGKFSKNDKCKKNELSLVRGSINTCKFDVNTCKFNMAFCVRISLFTQRHCIRNLDPYRKLKMSSINFKLLNNIIGLITTLKILSQISKLSIKY